MGAGDPLGVQEESGQSVLLAQAAVDSALAVAHVADHLVGEVCEMASDLMAPAGVQTGFEEREAVDLGEASEAGVRLLWLSRLGVQGSATLECEIGRSTRQNQIGLQRIGRGEGGVGGGRRLGVESKEDHARGGAIEAVDGVEVAADPVAHDLKERHPVARFAAAMDEQAAGFVHRDDAFVVVEDLELRDQRSVTSAQTAPSRSPTASPRRAAQVSVAPNSVRQAQSRREEKCSECS